MQWVPQRPPTRRVRLSAIAVVAIPILLLVIGTLVLLWQLLGATNAVGQ
jgi:hypothetical protein